MKKLLVVTLLVMAGSRFGIEPAAAQETATGVTAQQGSGRFLGLDLFAGGAAYSTTPDETNDDFGKFGLDAGANLIYGQRWAGITTAFGRHFMDEVATYHFVAGPRFQTTKWGLHGGRAFAHVLVGFARTFGVTPSETSAEWVVGGGFDLTVLRFQFDRVHQNLSGLQNNDFRVFIGGVVSLCFRACRESDGFNVSGHPREK